MVIDNDNNNNNRRPWVIKKGIKHYLHEIPSSNNLQEIQKTALLGTAHILRKVLSIK